MADHQIRKCPICGQTDDSPRHVDDRATGLPLPFHVDCHANSGCGVCVAVLARPEVTGKQNDELRTVLEPLSHLQWSLTEDGVVTYTENVEA
jgi:hypothetical protein